MFAWLSQVLSIMGFAFAMPFVAYYLQEDLGVTSVEDAKVWTGVFLIAAPLSLGIMSPIWGILADRYGRKLMMLRANLGASVVLILMGFAPNVAVLVLLRFLQGAFTGTVTAAQTLVASYTPERRHGMALGAMSAAIFAGSALGVYTGAKFAHAYGYRLAFVASGVLTFLAFALILFGVRERFVPPERRRRPWRPRLPSVGLGGPILLLVMATACVRQFDIPALPFLVQQICWGNIKEAGLWVADISVMFAIGAFLSGFTLGWVADRCRPANMAKVCAVGASLAMIPQMLAVTFAPLLVGRFFMAFCAGGLDPVFQIWLARVTPRGKRGAVFGWAVTAKSFGWVVGYGTSTFVAREWGARYSFFVAAELFVLLVLLITFVTARVRHPATEGRVEDSAEADAAPP